MINEPVRSAARRAREAHLSVQGKACSFPEGFFLCLFFLLLVFKNALTQLGPSWWNPSFYHYYVESMFLDFLMESWPVPRQRRTSAPPSLHSVVWVCSPNPHLQCRVGEVPEWQWGQCPNSVKTPAGWCHLLVPACPFWTSLTQTHELNSTECPARPQRGTVG